MSTPTQPLSRPAASLVRLEGRTLRDAGGTPLAILGDDDLWRTPAGVLTTELALCDAPVVARVDLAAAAAAQKLADEAWRNAGLEAVAALARRLPELTTDDVWAHLAMPPREGRQLGALMAAARGAGILAATDEHRPSARGLNHRRPVRVWRSLLHPSVSA